MRHSCQSLIIHCIDFRLQKAIKKYLDDHGLIGDIDVISVAGAVKNLISPEKQGDLEFILHQIETSKKLHGIKKLILMNHTDCGAYGGKEAFGSQDLECEQHISDMKKAKEIILAKFPDLEIMTILANLTPEGKIDFLLDKNTKGR